MYLFKENDLCRSVNWEVCNKWDASNVIERKENKQEFKVPEEVKSGAQVRDLTPGQDTKSPFLYNEGKEKKKIKTDIDSLRL